MLSKRVRSWCGKAERNQLGRILRTHRARLLQPRRIATHGIQQTESVEDAVALT